MTSFKIAVKTGLETKFCFNVVNKGCYGYYVIVSSNNKKEIKERRLSKCDVIIFIYFCILNTNANVGKDLKRSPDLLDFING